MTMRTDTRPPHTWFNVPICFLDESDQATVDLVLFRALDGLTLHLLTADGQRRDVKLKSANASFDEALYERTGDALAATTMEFHVLDTEYRPTDQTFQVPYRDVVSLGVY